MMTRPSRKKPCESHHLPQVARDHELPRQQPQVARKLYFFWLAQAKKKTVYLPSALTFQQLSTAGQRYHATYMIYDKTGNDTVTHLLVLRKADMKAGLAITRC